MIAPFRIAELHLNGSRRLLRAATAQWVNGPRKGPEASLESTKTYHQLQGTSVWLREALHTSYAIQPTVRNNQVDGVVGGVVGGGRGSGR